MNENVNRSISLTMLMIVSFCLPMLGALDAPAALADDKSRDNVPSPCLGADACRGVDAGVVYDDAIDLTEDFSFGYTNETISYTGEMNATGYSSTADTNNDMYIIDMEPGFGMTVNISWNGTGSTYDSRAYIVAVGYADEVASYSSGTFAYDYDYSNGINFVSVSTYDGQSPLSSSGNNYVDFPIDVMGDELAIWVWCYYCGTSYSSNLNYTMNVTTWYGDGGTPGDQMPETLDLLLDMPDVPFSWSYQEGTFELDGSTTAQVFVTYCDTWCDPETRIDITKPDGTVDIWDPLPDFFTGLIANYTDAGVYTVEKFDGYGDGGMGLEVQVNLGNFSGLMTVSDTDMEDGVSGIVGQSDETDIYAIVIPENYKFNLTLEWDDYTTDLDLILYTAYDEVNGPSGFFDFSYSSFPEFIQLGQTESKTMIFAEVEYYSGSSSYAGYTLTLAAEPGSPPPCYNQDDGSAVGQGEYTGSGSDASSDTSTSGIIGNDEVINTTGMDQWTGMLCNQQDPVDWFTYTVPEGMGAWFILDWDEGEPDPAFNDTEEISADLDLAVYMDSGSSYLSTVGTSPWENPIPAIVTTNESWTYRNNVLDETDVYLRVDTDGITEDYELNYTISVIMYDQTTTPYSATDQNDAGIGDDASDSTSSWAGGPTVIPDVNQTFTGYVHDYADTYDYYQIFVPDNYALGVNLTFETENNFELAIGVPSTWGGFSTICSDIGKYEFDGHRECYADYEDNNQDVWIRVYAERGGSDYELDIDMIWPGTGPADFQNDCDTGVDAYYHSYSDFDEATWLGGNPLHMMNGDPDNYTGPYEGGACSAWMDIQWDNLDSYHITVPHNSSLQVDLDFNPNGDRDPFQNWVSLVYCTPQHLTCTPTGGIYQYTTMDSYSGTDQQVSLNSEFWPVSNMFNASGDINGVEDTYGWAMLRIQTNGYNVDYEINVSYGEYDGASVNFVENDANSGMDAGSSFTTAVYVNDYLNQSQADLLANNSTLQWNGWSISFADDSDYYTFEVPANHVANISISPGYAVTGSTPVWLQLNMWDENQNSLCCSTFFENPTTYDMSFSEAQPTPWNMTIDVNQGQTAVISDTVGTNYTVTVFFYSLDSDGDGWMDSIENQCGPDLDGDGIPDGTDPNNASDSPNDFDGDGICDALDDDIDGDGLDNDLDDVDFDSNTSASDTDGDGIVDIDDLDDDNDGWDDLYEYICVYEIGGAPAYAGLQDNIMPYDYDNDGLCDIDAAMSWTNDSTGDGNGDLTVEEWIMMHGQTEAYTVTSKLDYNPAAIYGYLDMDADNDGIEDENDAFRFDECASIDTDGDGMPDEIHTGHTLLIEVVIENATHSVCSDAYTPSGLEVDMDDDDDTYSDEYEMDCLSDHLDVMDIPVDSTLPSGDGVCDELDEDDDNDGYNDDVDAFSLDPNEWSDYDMDGYGDNTDMDDDNDGYWDSCEPADWLTAQLVETIEGLNSFNNTSDGLPASCPLATDLFPLDSNEWIDSDGDGIGNNADEDDDGDGFDDFEELQCDSDSMDDNSIPIDTDSDEVCDFVDNDDDGDGFNDITEIECNTDSLNDKSFPVDFDGDGICDYIDLDDDGDGLSDENETSIHDTNPLDGDSDDDGLNDYEEVIIYETNAKNNDTDGDSLDDNEEVNIHGTNPLMIDSDLDGLTDGDEIQIWNSNPLIYDADNDSDSSYHFEDCNDEDQNIYPGNEELLNNIDDNCDNLVDEGYNDTDSDSDGLVDWSEYHIYGTNILDGDSDGDGISDLVEIDVTNSDPLSFDEDEDEDGFYWFEDCDDFNDNRNPGLLEILDDTDNDCDEDVDEDFTSIDSDSDGLTDYDEYHFYFTNPNIGDTDGDSLPDGYEVNILNSNPIFTDQDKDADGKFEFEDCDDNDFDVSPGTPEKLDGKDNDCDEEIDEDYKIIDSDGDLILDYDEYHNYSTSALLFDSDQDGLDDGTEILIKNSDPLKFDYDRDKDGFFEFEDCDDRSPSVNPDSNEIWNGIDDDCNQMIDEEINRRLVIFTNPQLETENSSGIVWDLTNDSLIFEISGLPSQLDLDISWNILGFDLDNYVSNNGKRLFLPSIECMNPVNDLEIQICDEGEMIQKLTVVIDDSVEEIEIFWSLQIDIWIEPMPSSENLFDSITGISGIVSVVISSLILIIATILVRSKISHKRKLEDALEAYGIIPERLAVSPEARGLDLPSAPEIVKIPDERI